MDEFRTQSTLSAAYVPDTFDLRIDDYQLQFRLPNSVDIARMMENMLSEDNPSLNSQVAEVERASKEMLKGCILKAKHSGKVFDINQLPEPMLAALSRRIAELDPQAEILIDLTCPECSHRWEVLFNIADFLWTEINEWAERTLQTVHKLASAYGWSEREILKLSPVRRQLYLGLVGP
jgi:hypothetical protein